MKLSIIELFLMCLMALAILQVTKSQNNPQDYLNLHNAARAQVGVGSMTWDDRLAIFAQNYANRMAGSCSLTHSGGPYGENIARSSGDMAAAGAVNMWVKEKGDYNHNANTCNAGKVCGHYTQVVWRNSGRLGCGRARCNNGGTFIICSYDPRGNIVGQRPY